jgi:uncharacterized membrane-anchored protein
MKTTALLAALTAAAAFGQNEGDTPRPALSYEKGAVSVRASGAAIAAVDLPEGWLYLQQSDARLVVEKAWGNPPNPRLCGLAVPPGQDLFADESWAVVIQYEDSGHVDDADAKAIDYDDLLKQMREDDVDSNRERKRAGYPTLELVGWAAPPHYDAAAKKLYWAKNLRPEGATENVLNYDVRVLARGGVLEMVGVASAQQFSAVSQGMQSLLGATKLNAGYRYDEYREGDKLAAYGIGGLIAGKVLAKAGIFKLLIKGGVVALAAAAALWKKLSGGSRTARARG